MLECDLHIDVFGHVTCWCHLVGRLKQNGSKMVLYSTSPHIIPSLTPPLSTAAMAKVDAYKLIMCLKTNVKDT